MSDFGLPPSGASLVERAKAIILNPKAEWPKIDADPAGIGEIYKSHVIPLALIGPVATLIGSQLFGHSFLGVTYKPGFVSSIVTAAMTFGATLASVYILALIIDALAPTFGAVPDRVRAFKLAAYSGTAAWLAGIFGIFPSLGFLGLLALYSLYLIYLGLPVLMKAPAEKAGGYTAAVVVAAIVVSLVMAAIAGVVGNSLSGPIPTSGDSVSGSLTLPGGKAVDLSEMEAASKKLEKAATDMQNGTGAPAIPVDSLKALLPESLPGGLARTGVESSSASAAGIGGSNVEARYEAGENRITLSLTDLGAVGGLAAIGSALNLEQSKEDGTSYEKTGKVDGRMTQEKFDSASKYGSYGILVGDRVMVEAKGNAESIDALKGAVTAIDLGAVEGLIGG